MVSALKKKSKKYVDVTADAFDDIPNDEPEEEKEEKEEDDDKVDVNSIEVVVERIEGGLIGSLRIDNDINKPIFKKDDIVHIRAPQKFAKSDFVLYKSHDEYFLRRIIKYKQDDIYVAGDKEKEYHTIRKEDIIGKVIGRERGKKLLTMALVNRKQAYTFRKVNLAFLRLGNRVLDYEGEVNNEAFENAMQNIAAVQQEANKKVEYKIDIDLDSDLKSFMDPDLLVDQLEEANRQAQALAAADGEEYEYVEEEEYEEVEYVEEESEEEEVQEEEIIEEEKVETLEEKLAAEELEQSLIDDEAN